MEIEEGSYGKMSLCDSYFPRWQIGLSPVVLLVDDVAHDVGHSVGLFVGGERHVFSAYG